MAELYTTNALRPQKTYAFQTDTLRIDMNPIYPKARFLKSSPNARDLPPDVGFEVAFAGRSNSGKSSAINTICNQRALARTSKTPGRTQLINVFELPDGRRLIDLPGYGYAKVPEAIRRDWGKMIEGYLVNRQSLRGLVLVMDIRHPLTDYDAQMLEWAHHRHLPVHVLLSKADKLKFGAAKTTLLTVQRALREQGLRASAQLFSSLKKTGTEEAFAVLDAWLEWPREEGDRQSS